jgi:hypothetical protein
MKKMFFYIFLNVNVPLYDDEKEKRKGLKIKALKNFEEKRNLASCLLFKEVTTDDHNNTRGNDGTLVIE